MLRWPDCTSFYSYSNALRGCVDMTGRLSIAGLSVEILDPALNKFFFHLHVESQAAHPDQIAPGQGIRLRL